MFNYETKYYKIDKIEMFLLRAKQIRCFDREETKRKLGYGIIGG